MRSSSRWRFLIVGLLAVFAQDFGRAQAPAFPEAVRSEERYRQVLRATAWVVTPGSSRGTGWLIDRSRRWLVTSYHVAGEHDAMEVFFPAERGGQPIVDRAHYLENRRQLRVAGLAVEGRVLHREKSCDLALIELESLPRSALALPLAARGARPGDDLYSIGNRRDSDALWVHASGNVRQVFRSEEGYYWRSLPLARKAMLLAAQSPINEGDSGGPIVNDRGEVVAVAAAVRWQLPLASLCIDVSELRAFLARAPRPLPEPGKPGPGAAGLSPGHQVYRGAIRKVALVKAGGANTRATGWVLDASRKLLLTSFQAVDRNSSVDVFFPVFADDQPIAEWRWYRDQEDRLRERGQAVRGWVIGRDARRNLALLELDALPMGTAEVELAARPPAPGDRLHALGNPNNIEALWVYTAGVVRQVHKANLGRTDQPPDPQVVLAQLPLSDGDAGGPVLNEAGQLVAVASGKDAPQQLLSYCLHVQEVKAFVQDLEPRWHPRSAAEHHQRGLLDLQLRRPDRAVAAFSEALRLDPALTQARAARGLAHRHQGDLGKAIADGTEAIRQEPKRADAWCYRAWARIDGGGLDAARADLQTALALDPRHVLALTLRANIHRRKGELERALADCAEAIALDPNWADAFHERARAQGDLGNLNQALIDLTHAIGLDPNDPGLFLDRGILHARKGDSSRALADYGEALRLDPRQAAGYFHRGLELAGLKEFDRAAADLGKAVRLDGRLASAVLLAVEQRGAELGKATDPDWQTCRALYRTSLQAVQPLGERQPGVAKIITSALRESDGNENVREQCHALAAALKLLRARLGP